MKLNKRKFKYGTMSIVLTAVFAVILVLFNVLTSFAVDRFALKIDMTPNRTYELQKEVKDFIKDYTTDATIYVTHDSSYTVTNTPELIQTYEKAKKLAALNGHIKVESVNVEKNPQFKSKYPNVDFNSYPVIIETNLRYKAYPITDLYQYSQSQYTGEVTSYSYVEECLASGLMFTSAERLPKMLFVTGHNENDADAFKNLLSSNVISVTTERIDTKEGISPEYDTIAIVAPMRDYSIEELNAINDFLTNDEKYNKNLVIFFDPSQPDLPNLEAYMAEWGVEITDGILYETDTSLLYYNNPSLFVPKYGENVYSGNSVSSPTPLMIYNARALKALWTEKDRRTISPLLQTYESARRVADASAIELNPDKDEQGPFDVGFLCQRKTLINEEYAYTNVFVYSSTDMLVQNLLTNTASFENASYFINVFDKMNGDINKFKLVPINITEDTISLDTGTVNTYNILLVIVLPVAILILGFIVWFKRRHA